MRRPLLHVGTKLRKLLRLKRFIKMHIEIHPIPAEHGSKQHLCIKTRTLDPMQLKKIRRPCENIRDRPHAFCHQFTCFRHSA